MNTNRPKQVESLSVSRLLSSRLIFWLLFASMNGLVLLWIFSLWVAWYTRLGLWTATISGGALTIWKAAPNNPRYGGINDMSFIPTDSLSLYNLIPHFSASPPVYDWIAHIPLWLPLLPLFIITMIFWKLDRRILVNLCPKCGYNRTGLDSDLPCPECGPSI